MARLSESAFRRYYGLVYRYLLRRTSDPAEAEELTQQVFADAAAAEERLEQDERPILPWLLAVARRRWVDARRATGRRQHALDTIGPEAASAARKDVVVAKASDDELAAALRQMLARLPPGQREVVVRRLWSGAGFREIASDLDLSEGAVKMRFRRGLESLRELLREEGYAP